MSALLLSVFLFELRKLEGRQLSGVLCQFKL